jgi:two-component system response regulator PilR (NtrC family)
MSEAATRQAPAPSDPGGAKTIIPFAPAASSPSRASARPRVLVVDDERSMRELLGIVLTREGYDVRTADGGVQAVAFLGREPVDLIVSDIRMPDVDGVDVLRAAKTHDPDVPVVMMTAFASTDTAVEALRLGASDYVTKPFDVDELKIVVRRALQRRELQQENLQLKRALNTSHQFADIIGRSDAILAVFRLIETIAPTSSTVLITGESGTGKELAARAIHFHSLRRDRPFVALNCGALPETLLESELFGHMRGAFTGAATNKKGLIEIADKGTIFLDEIGDMSPAMQVKLLRVLQERRYRRVGGTEEVEADIRIIAATNRDLAKDVREGRFREDLFYRVNVIPVVLPPLRDRRGDIALLAEHFVARFAQQMGKQIVGLSGDARAALEAYVWPGNIRELENAMERAVALEATPSVLRESLPEAVRLPPAAPADAGAGASPSGGSRSETTADLPAGFDLERHVQDVERQYITHALRRTNGVKTRAAGLLGMSFRSFRYYLKKYDIR